MTEQQMAPFAAVALLPATRVLVLAPHPDDEVFGCGGAIAASLAAGVPVHVVVLTDGAGQGQAEVRQAESRAAADQLGYGEPQFWGLPDRGQWEDQALAARLVAHIRETGADLLCAPSPWEVHPDHRQAARLAIQAALGTGVRVAFYEVGSPLHPNVLLDITPHMALKQRAMQCFGSQLAFQAYDRHIAALNQYRSYTLAPAVMAAEAYLLLTAAELLTLLPRLLSVFPVSFGAIPPDFAKLGANPLVSVVIRSLDRQTLQQALDTVALQTYPAIEVVVVAATPHHQRLPERCGPFVLRLITAGQPLARSAAANQGLQNAQGDYILLFDDDDLLLPGHIAGLVQVLRRQPQCLAAYSGVALVGPQGEPLGQVIDLPFDGIRQLSGNLTPIHAVLFDRKVLDLGCRFDESLGLLEDWDFWLQLATHTVFAHVPGTSALYRIHASSGVHIDSGPCGQASLRIYDKWQARWTSEQISGLMQRVWAHTDLEHQLENLQGQAEGLKLQHQHDQQHHQQQLEDMRHLASVLALGHEQQLLALRHQHEDRVQALQQATVGLQQGSDQQASEISSLTVLAGQLVDDIAALHASNSWRLTAPLRRLARWVRSMR